MASSVFVPGEDTETHLYNLDVCSKPPRNKIHNERLGIAGSFALHFMQLCGRDNTTYFLWLYLQHRGVVFFRSKLNINPPTMFEDGLRWLRNPSPDELVKLNVKLVFQAAIYNIWKERTAWIHNHIFLTVQAVILEIKKVVQVRLDPLSRAHNSRRTNITLLGM